MSDQQPTDTELRILAISGSLRVVSSNTAILRAMSILAPERVEIILYDQLADLPYFNPDLDGEAILPPPTVLELRSRIGRADGILISSPEYAHGVPGVLKNALDWLVSSLEFPGKPVALINASPRSTHAQAALTEILKTMSARLIAEASIAVPLASNRVDVADIIADPTSSQVLHAAIVAFVHAIEVSRAEVRSKD